MSAHRMIYTMKPVSYYDEQRVKRPRQGVWGLRRIKGGLILGTGDIDAALGHELTR